jgi:hypothetical protein
MQCPPRDSIVSSGPLGVGVGEGLGVAAALPHATMTRPKSRSGESLFNTVL